MSRNRDQAMFCVMVILMFLALSPLLKKLYLNRIHGHASNLFHVNPTKNGGLISQKGASCNFLIEVTSYLSVGGRGVISWLPQLTDLPLLNCT
ncbi:hypothetical protein CDAR_121171 [Caerostris darwini]|uniref:Uncharacterized protein n=1 Tax=Caerostris darwini TaxID=1538125 RepID=A0AAV4VGZ2_9ARAC|nr:hypothetical protein CDAR_121171 [Caerostris darwini]